MDTTEVNELAAAANYKAFSNSIRHWGIANIILGIFSITAGVIYGVVLSPINFLLVLIGLILIGGGIWAMGKVTVSELLFSGIMLLLLCGWNITVFLLNITSIVADFRVINQSAFLIPTTIGAFIWSFILIKYGVEAITKFIRYSSNPVSKPNDYTLKKIDTLFKAVYQTRFQKANDIIRFFIYNKDGKKWQEQWQGKLDHPYGMLVRQGGSDIQIVRPEDMEITTGGKPSGGYRFGGMPNWQHATFIIKKSTYKGYIHPSSLERYMGWKNSPSLSGSSELKFSESGK